MKGMLCAWLIAAATMIAPSAGRAEGVESALSGLAIGTDYGSAQNPYRGDDSDRRMRAIVSYRTKDLRLAPDSLDYRALDTASSDLWLRIRYRDDGYDLGDGVGTVSAHSRGKGLWLGARSIVSMPWADLQTTFMTGASTEAKGQTLSFRVTRKFFFGPVTIAPRASVTRLSGAYVDHFYGVDSLTRDDAGFIARPAWTTEVGAQVALKLNDHQTLSLDVMTTHLGSAVTASPLVARSNVLEVHAGYIYRF